MKSIVIKSLFFIFVIISLFWFYFIWNNVNYKLHYEIRKIQVNHPEFIPSAKLVKASSSWLENLVSDFYWMSAIQYIWMNSVASEYKKYLYTLLNLVTDLNPNFSYPYTIGELLLSSYNDKFEITSKLDQTNYNSQSRNLWLKWISKLCDASKIKLIDSEYDLKKLWTDPKYLNPCLDPDIPYYLAYIYYYVYFDGAKASLYYKVTSANSDWPPWARIMAAIMQGKSWDREKSIMMFLSIAESLGSKNTIQCQDFSTKLRNDLFWIFWKKIKLNSTYIKSLNDYWKSLPKQPQDGSIYWRTNCYKYLNKAIREINLTYLEENDKNFFNENNYHAYSAKELFDKNYISYLPIDSEWTKNVPINYFFNKDTWHWDVEVKNY